MPQTSQRTDGAVCRCDMGLEEVLAENKCLVYHGTGMRIIERSHPPNDTWAAELSMQHHGLSQRLFLVLTIDPVFPSPLLPSPTRKYDPRGET